MGQVVGTVTIAGKEYPFNIDSMRDHSYGKQNKNKTLFQFFFNWKIWQIIIIRS